MSKLVMNIKKSIAEDYTMFATEIFKRAGTEELTLDDFLQEASEYFKEDTKKDTKKAKRVTKKIPQDERCVAMKKDKTQCNGKKSVKEGKNQELCTIHNNSGANYGLINEASSSKTVPKKDKDIKQKKGKSPASSSTDELEHIEDEEDMDGMFSE